MASVPVGAVNTVTVGLRENFNVNDAVLFTDATGPIGSRFTISNGMYNTNVMLFVVTVPVYANTDAVAGSSAKM